MTNTASVSKEKSAKRTPRERIAAALHSRFALRFHTSILLLWMSSAGLLTIQGLFALGMQSIFFRYTIAIVVVYGAFLLDARLWLAYVGAGDVVPTVRLVKLALAGCMMAPLFTRAESL